MDSCKKYRKNECDVTLLPAGEVYRLVANSMKSHYDSEIEMYELSYDLRNQYSVYNRYMMDKHPSIFSATPAASANVDDTCDKQRCDSWKNTKRELLPSLHEY